MGSRVEITVRACPAGATARAPRSAEMACSPRPIVALPQIREPGGVSVDRPELERCVVDVDLPVESSVTEEASQRLVDHIHPPPARAGIRRPASDVVDPDPHVRVIRLAAHEELV